MAKKAIASKSKTKLTKAKAKPVQAKSKRKFQTITVGTQYWNPETEGEFIEGKLVEVKNQPKYKGKKGETEQRVILETEDKKRWMLPAHWQINAAVEEHKDGFYSFTVSTMGGKKGANGKNTSYQYEIGYSAK